MNLRAAAERGKNDASVGRPGDAFNVQPGELRKIARLRSVGIADEELVAAEIGGDVG